MAESSATFSFHTVCILVTFIQSNAVLPGVWGIRNLNVSKASVSTLDTGRLFPALLIFGDSTVDAGNNNFLATLVRSDFLPYGMNYEGGRPTGRFTDGLLATDFISQKVGIPFQLPYLSPQAHGEAILTGINFASSASGWYEDTATHFNVKGLATQLQWYQNWKAEVLRIAGPEKGNYIIENALSVISTGTNDWVNNYYLNPLLQKRYTPDQYTTMLLGLVRQYVQDLFTLGGRNIIIFNLPPLGCVPQQITLHGRGYQGCVKSMNDIANSFNKQLYVLVEEMKKTMPRSRLILFDTYEVIYDAFQRPQKYGFKYARTGCCGTGILEVSILCNKATPTCRNPNEHIFWDSFHPTSHFYSQLADMIYNHIEPILQAPPNP